MFAASKFCFLVAILARHESFQPLSLIVSIEAFTPTTLLTTSRIENIYTTTQKWSSVIEPNKDTVETTPASLAPPTLFTEKRINKMVTQTPTTLNLAYPTSRGSTVDSRKIISTDTLSAIRISHILFASEELAKLSLGSLRNADIEFGELAKSISACEFSRKDGGSIGWMNVQEDEELEPNTSEEAGDDVSDGISGINEHLDEILPLEAREEVLNTSSKPGDIILVTSSRGYHLIQIVDVMVDVRKMSSKKSRTVNYKRKHTSLSGLFAGNDLDGREKKVLHYKIETMGCQMNLADSERIEGQLQNLGMLPLPEWDGIGKKKKSQQKLDPDVVILNTCSIRDHAEKKVYSYIGPHAKRKREGEDVTIIVAGCVAQQEGAMLLRRAPEVDLVMGPQYANRIGDLLEDVANGNQVVATEASHIMEDSTKPRRGSTTAAWVNVIYGCNERCTYCIVPTTRGVEQSRPVESIVEEVVGLVEAGYKEITLLGQNIDAYGRDMSPKRKFSDLIRIIGSIPKLKRLRFVTSHPKYMSLGVVDAVAETQTACEGFHVPFQSGSNAILQAMGRGHTREKYFKIIDRIRSKLPDAAITADVIVGFPGETDDDFRDTLTLMEEVKFDSVNTAAYSPRPNTPAAEWTNQLSEEVKTNRLGQVNRLNLKHAAERRARMMGRTVEVLIEERNIKVPTQVMGRTRHGYIVYCDGDIDELRGETVQIEIDECYTYYLSGSMVLAP